MKISRQSVQAVCCKLSHSVRERIEWLSSDLTHATASNGSMRAGTSSSITEVATGHSTVWPAIVVFGPASRDIFSSLATATTFLAIIVLFTISPILLESWGVGYIGAGSGLFAKVHPATVIAAAAVFLRCLSARRPMLEAWRIATDDPGALLLSSSVMIAVMFAAIIDKIPVMPLIDTFVLPLLVFRLLRFLDKRQAAFLTTALAAILVVNAGLAIFEYHRGVHLIHVDVPPNTFYDPARSDLLSAWPIVSATDWRAQALLGHPLVNGLVAGTMVICLAARGSNWIPIVPRAALLGVQALSLFAFGARTAIVLAAVFAFVLIAVRLVAAFKRGDRLTPKAGALIIITISVSLIAGILLVYSGLTDKTLDRFINDSGSAATRVTMFTILNSISLPDLFLHPDKDVVATLTRIYGLELGIESSWVGFALSYGIIVAAMIVAGLLAFWRSILRVSGRGGLAVCIFYLISVSVTESLSSKTTSLAMAVTLVILFLRNDTSLASAVQRNNREKASMELPDLSSGVRHARTPKLATRSWEPTTGLLAIVWHHKLLILVSTLVCLALGIAFLAVTPPRYTATAAMLIDPRLGKMVGSDPNVPGFVADTAAIDSQIKLFTSQTVLSRVAAQTDLRTDPEFNGTRRSLLQRILHPEANVTDGVDLKSLEDAITIKRPERTYVVQIDVVARDPERAAAIANAVTQAYIADQVGSRVGAAKEDAQYVANKLDRLSLEIRDVDNQIEGYKVANQIIESNGLRSNEQQVGDLTKGLGDARMKETEAQARLVEINNLADHGLLDSSSEALKSPTIERLRQQQGETEQTVARLSMTLGGHHPELISTRKRQARLRELIQDELQRVKNGLEADFKAAKASEQQTLVEIDQVKRQSAEMSAKLIPLDQMQRNRAVLRSSFDRFAQVNDTLAQQGAQSPPGRIIAVARPPVSPSSPKKSLVGIVALSAGLFIGLAGALLANDALPPGYPQDPAKHGDGGQPPVSGRSATNDAMLPEANRTERVSEGSKPDTALSKSHTGSKRRRRRTTGANTSHGRA